MTSTVTNSFEITHDEVLNAKTETELWEKYVDPWFDELRAEGREVYADRVTHMAAESRRNIGGILLIVTVPVGRKQTSESSSKVPASYWRLVDDRLQSVINEEGAANLAQYRPDWIIFQAELAPIDDTIYTHTIWVNNGQKICESKLQSGMVRMGPKGTSPCPTCMKLLTIMSR